VTASVKLLERPPPAFFGYSLIPILSLGPFLWFGGNAGDKIPDLGDRVARHTKPNATLKKADRPGHRVIAKNQFAPPETIDCVIARLIGV
jgi:hypothetical protein